MLSSEARKRLCIVLVGARNPQNIGAAARAMQDFGFGDLRVVNTFAPPFEAAQLETTSAVAAGEVMRHAKLFATLPEAIADCTLVAGTTAIGGRDLTRPVRPLAEAASDLLQALSPTPSTIPSEKSDISRVALLFGSEKTGLTNEQLSYCSSLLTIPMFAPDGRHLSMNLGQSVAVCLYELVRSGFEGSRNPSRLSRPAPEADLRERVVGALLQVMHASGYTHRFPANSRPEVVRQLSLQLGQNKEEAITWLGFFKQLLNCLQ